MSGDGHIIPEHSMVLAEGYGGLAARARSCLARDGQGMGRLSAAQREFYEAVIIAMEGALRYIKRLGKAAAADAEGEQDPGRKAELEEMAAKTQSQGPGLSPSQRKEIAEIKLMLRAILSMAKSLLKRGAKAPGAEGAEGAEGADAAEARKAVEAAEKDIEEAMEEIDVV
jgi:formate C-acetyltransferase